MSINRLSSDVHFPSTNRPSLLSSKSFRITLLAAILTTTAVYIYHFCNANRNSTAYINLNNISPNGFAYNETNGQIKGDPQNGIEDLKRLYAMIKIYQQRGNMKCVGRTSQVIRDAQANPKAYGFRSSEEVFRVLSNPDDKYGDSTHQKAGNIIPYITPCTRPDGKTIGSPKAPGTRDVLAYTDLYYYQNIKLFPHKETTFNPVGFYLVLWDDGGVEQIPYTKAMFIHQKNGYTIGFRDQAGVSNDALTYNQFYQKLGMNRGPIGHEGARGESAEIINAIASNK